MLLDPRQVDPDTITVSGYSGGSFFASQFHVAHSSMVKGAGLQNGGPYHCVKEWWFFERCTFGKPADGDALFGNDPPKVEDSLEYAKEMKKEKKIDDTENLNGQPVYVLRGL